MAWFGLVKRHDSLCSTILQSTVEGRLRRARQTKLVGQCQAMQRCDYTRIADGCCWQTVVREIQCSFFIRISPTITKINVLMIMMNEKKLIQTVKSYVPCMETVRWLSMYFVMFRSGHYDLEDRELMTRSKWWLKNDLQTQSIAHIHGITIINIVRQLKTVGCVNRNDL